MVELADRVLLPMRTLDGLWRPDRDLQPGVHIVRDADEWTRLWWSASRDLPEPPVLAVDWRTEMCVVVALGTRSSGGYFVMIDVIEVIGAQITVLAWEIRPGPNCGTSRALTRPFHAVAAPTRAGRAKLVKRIAYEDCEATEY
jgi:hypothetical protein